VLHSVQSGVARDIAMGIGISSVIFAIAIYLPILGFFVSLFVPLPILFYRAKLGRQTGAIVPMAAIVAMGIIAGGVNIDVLAFAAMLLLGFTLSELYEKNLTVERTVAFASGAVILAGLIGLILYTVVINVPLGRFISDYVDHNLQITLAIYERLGAPQESIHMLTVSMDRIQYALVRIIPSLTVTSTLFVAWINLLASKPLLLSKGIAFPEFGTLNRWRAPEQLVWGVIGSGVMLLIPSSAMKLIGINGLFILLTVYFFQGMAIVAFYFEKKQFPRLLRVFLYSLIALQQIVLLVIVALGFFDVWINFRKLGKPSQDQNEA
jgi:uncharacterized protein YybS (DUF2232 family)